MQLIPVFFQPEKDLNAFVHKESSYSSLIDYILFRNEAVTTQNCNHNPIQAFIFRFGYVLHRQLYCH